jgi:hypothetical protein
VQKNFNINKMSSQNPNVNRKTWRDETFDNVKTGTIDIDRSIRLPIEPDDTIQAELVFKGRLAYDDEVDKLMYCNGDIWVVVGNGTVTQINTGTGLTGGPITTSGTISIANTGVTPGSYTYSSVTVNAQGQITSIANGVPPVASVSAGTGISITGTATVPIVNIANTGVVAGTYNDVTCTVNAQGQLTSIASGTLTSQNSVDFMSTQNTGAGRNPLDFNVPIVTYNNLVSFPGFNATDGLFTVSRSGWYIITGNCHVPAVVGSFGISLQIEKVSGVNTFIVSKTQADNTITSDMTVSAVVHANAADTFQIIFNNSNGTPQLTNHVSFSYYGA